MSTDSNRRDFLKVTAAAGARPRARRRGRRVLGPRVHPTALRQRG